MVAGFGGSAASKDAWLALSMGVGLGDDSPLRYFTALQDGVPVATALLFLAAGVAGLYSVVTMPEARRQGLGGAVTLAALRDARSMGYRAGVLGSSEMGQGMYSRLGFVEYCKLGEYRWRYR